MPSTLEKNDRHLKNEWEKFILNVWDQENAFKYNVDGGPTSGSSITYFSVSESDSGNSSFIIISIIQREVSSLVILNVLS